MDKQGELKKIEAEIAQKEAQLAVEEVKFTAYSGFTQEKCGEQDNQAARLVSKKAASR